MSRMEVPIQNDVLYSTGDLLLRAEVDLWVRNGVGSWTTETFRVDSGSEISAMPAWYAKKLGLPMPQAGVTSPRAAVLFLI